MNKDTPRSDAAEAAESAEETVEWLGWRQQGTGNPIRGFLPFRSGQFCRSLLASLNESGSRTASVRSKEV
jgi:hypothetical protein